MTKKTKTWAAVLSLLLAVGVAVSALAAPPSPSGEAVRIANLGVSSGASILTSSLTPSVSHPDVAYAVTVATLAASKVSVRVTITGGTQDGETWDEPLNDDAALVATALNTFTFGASREFQNMSGGVASYNFVLDTSTELVRLHVTEIRSDTR